MSYKILDIKRVTKYAKNTSQIASMLRSGEYTATEVGDGNLNLVFIAGNPSNGTSVVLKQALPYLHCVCECLYFCVHKKRDKQTQSAYQSGGAGYQERRKLQVKSDGAKIYLYEKGRGLTTAGFTHGLGDAKRERHLSSTPNLHLSDLSALIWAQ